MPLRAAPAALRSTAARRRAAHVAFSVARRRSVFVSGLLQIASRGEGLPPGGSSAVLDSNCFNGLFAMWETSLLQNWPLQIRLVWSETSGFWVFSDAFCAGCRGIRGVVACGRCACSRGAWEEGRGWDGVGAMGSCQGVFGCWRRLSRRRPLRVPRTCPGFPLSRERRSGGSGADRACGGWWGRAAARRTSGYPFAGTTSGGCGKYARSPWRAPRETVRQIAAGVDSPAIDGGSGAEALGSLTLGYQRSYANQQAHARRWRGSRLELPLQVLRRSGRTGVSRRRWPVSRWTRAR